MTVPRAWRVDDTEDQLVVLYREHYRGLVRLAALLTGDVARSEELVQDAFVKLHTRPGGLARVHNAPAYLRSTVLNGARSHLRHQQVRGRHAVRRTVLSVVPSAEAGALLGEQHRVVVDALRSLPERQREALVLRYYFELSEAEMAQAMGVSAGSVKTHLHRGLAALSALVQEEDR